MNGLRGEEAIACFTGRKCTAALRGLRLPHYDRNDIVYN